ncbi:MAG: tRNA (adenosine(37)-N6)-threonylcarbamoyltransferase complex ATPase subunit type 1 TsaE [Candidatus Melainabacteria bacterium HGW-Melainabacteria-1]|nr:MAG: tRNA (adenosine(37)-N6)-threonylcarbamoyltransferase complex ATPase subunit type 1 TsaE [Candidatus Melainabacteria bacterium HGW-Melainabacteria-1]
MKPKLQQPLSLTLQGPHSNLQAFITHHPMPSLHLTLPDAAATHALGRLIGSLCPLPLLIGLSGELGVGKTTLSQGIGQSFGVDDPITSPTFTLINEYETSRGRLYHLDLYRLGSLDELLELGLEDMLAQRNALMLVEWFDRFADWPEGPPLLQIRFEHLAAGRSVWLSLPPQAKALTEALSARLNTEGQWMN